MLGDIYVTLAWMAFQRMRYGSARRGTFEAPAVTAIRPHQADEEGADSATRHRG